MTDEEDVFALAAEDASHKIDITEDAATTISKLALRKQSLEDSIGRLEAQTANLKKELQRVDEHDLPEAMDRVGMSKFSLLDGTEVSVSTFYNASISEERKPEAFGWMIEHGHGGMIKTEVKLAFGKGDLEEAQAFLSWLREEKPDMNPDLNQSVHWQTLRAFVKEQVESGAALPMDTLGIYIGRKAKLKLPKDKK